METPDRTTTDRGDAEAAARIHAWLERSEERGFSGAVLVARGGRIVLSRGYGSAHRGNGTPASPATVFNIGALTRSFTAAAILKLVELDRLRLDDPLSEFFPGLPADKRDITLHELLTGARRFSGRAEGYPYDYVSRGEYLDSLFRMPLTEGRGSGSAGFILLAAVVEVVSGRGYEEFLRRHFFTPAGMTDTGYVLPVWSNTALAHGYFYDIFEERWMDWGHTAARLAEQGASWHTVGSGDLQSSTLDLYAWQRALDAGGLLAPELRALMDGPQGPAAGAGAPAYGWTATRSVRGTPVLHQGGSNGYYRADVLRFPEEDTVVISLSNLARGEETAWHVAGLLFDAAYRPPPFPLDGYELVVNFMRGRAPSQVDELPAWFLDLQQYPLDDPALLHPLGLQQMNRGEGAWAVALLELNVRLFPQEGNFWDSLGDAYLAEGREEDAARSFREAIRLAPASGCFWCLNSQQRLDELTASP